MTKEAELSNTLHKLASEIVADSASKLHEIYSGTLRMVNKEGEDKTDLLETMLFSRLVSYIKILSDIRGKGADND